MDPFLAERDAKEDRMNEFEAEARLERLIEEKEKENKDENK